MLQIAWRNIWRNPSRTLFAILALSGAITFAILLRATQKGQHDSLVKGLTSGFTGAARIQKKGYWEEPGLEHSISETILPPSYHYFKKASPRLESYALVNNGEQSIPGLIIGLKPDSDPLVEAYAKKLKIPPGGLVLAEGLSSALNANIGDTLIILGQGYHATQAAGKYPVTDILKVSAPILNRQLVLLDLGSAQELFATGKMVSGWILSEDDHLEASGLPEELEVINWRTMIPWLEQALFADSIASLVVQVMLYLVIAFGLFGTIMMMTAERKREFQTMLSFGCMRKKIISMICMETLIISLIALAIGILVGGAISLYGHEHPLKYIGETARGLENMGLPSVIPLATDPWIWIRQSFAVLLISLGLSVYPIWYVLRLKPIESR